MPAIRMLRNFARPVQGETLMLNNTLACFSA